MTYSIFEEGNLLSDEMLQQVATMQGIENLRVTYSASPWPTMDVIYSENVFGKYIDSLDGVSGLDFQMRKHGKTIQIIFGAAFTE